LAQSANDKHAQPYHIGQDFGYRKSSLTWDWYFGDRQICNLPEPGLKGEHQYRNASSAILAVIQLEDKLPISEDSIRIGLKDVRLSGRFQLVDGKIPVLLDVGHNPQAVRTLVEYLNKNFSGMRIHAVFSMMKDKDIAGVLEIMSPVIHDWYFAPLANLRAAGESVMRDIFSKSTVSNVFFGFTGFVDAFAAAQKQSQEGDLLLVFGSFFLVSECLFELEKGELTK
jgi:dihydrofolate synthase/folylpolyglutamate synthase